MNIKLNRYLTILPILSLLVACAQLGQMSVLDIEHQRVAQNAKTYDEHNKLVDYYDNLAKETASKLTEMKGLLKNYEDHSYYYGRGGQDFQSHTVANIRYYEQATKDAEKHAGFHRQVAAELLNREYAKSVESRDQPNNAQIKAKMSSDSGDLNESVIKAQ